MAKIRTDHKDIAETDFQIWYRYSQSAQSSRLAGQLKEVLNKREPLHGFALLSEQTGEETVWYLSEKYNPSVLRLTEKSCGEFLDYICAQYPDTQTTEEEDSGKADGQHVPAPEKDEKGFSKVQANKNSRQIIHIPEKISSKHKGKHALAFSLFAFLLLQILILPGNISAHQFGDWGIILFFGILCGMYFFSIWSYSRFYSPVRKYTDIFRLTVFYCSFLFLFIFIEIAFIDLFGDQFVLLFSLLLIIAGQLAGILLSLFLAMITYFIQGGRMISETQIKPG